MENYPKTLKVSTLDEKRPLPALRGGGAPSPVDFYKIARGMCHQPKIPPLRRRMAAFLRHSPLANKRRTTGGKVSPLGFITRPQSLTKPSPLLPLVSFSPDFISRFIPSPSASQSFYAEFDSHAEYEKDGKTLKQKKRVAARKHKLTVPERLAFVAEKQPDHRQRVIFKIRSYLSGEVTGGQSLTGSETKVIPPARSGALVTDQFTKAGSITIRRAVQCYNSDASQLNKFCTLTFAPSMIAEENKNPDGSVKHKWAKQELVRFLNTCSVKQKRLKRVLNYLWVAELQEDTRNIHFHILWDKFFDIKWLTKIWGQANNSVDIEKMNNSIHAANYMRKCTNYMTKDKNPIEGNRYFISQSLRESMKPTEKVLFEMSASEAKFDHAKGIVAELRDSLHAYQSYIESQGGHVMEFGFSIPPGRSPQKYKDKITGEEKQTKGVNPLLGKWVKSILHESARECSLQIVPF